MALAPIDLQTLFTQVDKVGKAQAAQKEGQAIQQSIHGVQLQRKTEELIKQVNETQDTGEGTDKINDRSNRSKQEHNKKNKNSVNDEDEKTEDRKQSNIFRDPSLGNKIDISL